MKLFFFFGRANESKTSSNMMFENSLLLPVNLITLIIATWAGHFSRSSPSLIFVHDTTLGGPSIPCPAQHYMGTLVPSV